MASVATLIKTLHSLEDKKRAVHAVRFFKTAPGQYGYGDVFLGLSVPLQRSVAKEYRTLSLRDLQKLLNSPVHEHRFVALILLNYQYEHGTEVARKKIYKFYLKNTQHINNWDLVDVSAHVIVGAYCLTYGDQPLYVLARSRSLWERRIAMIATLAYIRAGKLKQTTKIAEMLLTDTHDLIHKASGWMLREVGKRDRSALLNFLDVHAAHMPRTMLRYSIERLSPTERLKYLKSKID